MPCGTTDSSFSKQLCGGGTTKSKASCYDNLPIVVPLSFCWFLADLIGVRRPLDLLNCLRYWLGVT
ncbi:hypothetical protein DDV21_006565 [Streptococcus chenjunshii]|uniref:Uncharacterized protein n=1 Tax=Streptococcus chenjunshii TaxID=2173853 RepID=A0A372KPV9_9STRE|nr:hypothetical protein DDV21_006565 [Streptococcus chenjunshii]RFU51738.1 hypothetical protein DDV22_01975 [Streptococcus chenjunshii]RFU54299.1 hypothetical protein DDV23_00035 [Streptococcus chenjunshii]